MMFTEGKKALIGIEKLNKIQTMYFIVLKN